uniref:Uncharacterized protein n=1 Tax=Anguilla anguilla TaxID=7936 RepID=A0A0E9SXC3_ANGAN
MFVHIGFTVLFWLLVSPHSLPPLLSSALVIVFSLLL